LPDSKKDYDKYFDKIGKLADDYLDELDPFAQDYLDELQNCLG